jgi:hypothetical protein
MVVLYAVVALAVVFAIAAVVVGREARRLDAAPAQATFDLDEATAWVGNHLPFSVSAELSFDDVRRILEWNLDYLRAQGLSASGTPPHVSDEVVVAPEQVVAYLLEQAHRAGAPYTEDEVAAVLEAQLEYFDAIGAVGPEAGPEERPGSG